MSGVSTRARLPIFALCALFLALTIPMTLLGRLGTSEAGDQERFHWPTILAMSEAWPTVSLEKYRTATGPLYHAVLAAVVAVIGESQWPIRVLNALVSLPLVLLVYTLVRRHSSPWVAALFVLPIVLSTYVLSSAIWITTDNVAHWLVIAALVAATRSAPASSAVSSALAVGVRQIHIWVIAPCALARLLATDAKGGKVTPSPESASARGRAGEGVPRRLLQATFTAIPAIAVVALLIWWWNGLTPPFVEARHAAIGNPFGFGYTLSLVGLFGVFYLPAMWTGQRPLRGWMLPVLLLLAVALTVLSPTTLDKSAGRWGGALWELVDALPAIAERSIVFPPLAMCGALVLFVGCRRAAALRRSAEAFIVLTALACFTVAHSVQPWCAQRYFEPMTLVFVMWLASLCIPPRSAGRATSAGSIAPRLWVGPAALAAIQLLLSIYAVYWQSRPADM